MADSVFHAQMTWEYANEKGERSMFVRSVTINMKNGIWFRRQERLGERPGHFPKAGLFCDGNKIKYELVEERATPLIVVTTPEGIMQVYDSWRRVGWDACFLPENWLGCSVKRIVLSIAPEKREKW